MSKDKARQQRDILSARQVQLSAAKQALLEKRLQGKLAKERVIPRRQGQGPAVLSFAQQHLWFLNQLMPDSPFYNVPPLILRLKGPLNVEVLDRALNEIVRRHETLRTTFVTLEEQPVQVIEPASLAFFTLIDLGGLPRLEREAQAQQLATEEIHRPFDLAQGPLLRTILLQWGEDEHILILNTHHIITDAWSVRLLMRELETLHTAFLSNQPSPLPELPIQYADFADWQRRWLEQKIEDQLAYWR